MKKIKYVTLLVALVLSVTSTNAALVTNTTDSHMDRFKEITHGDVLSPGYYTYWAIYIEAEKKPEWVWITFRFDSRKESILTYIIPGYKEYIFAPGYMETWTNHVNVTVRGI